MLLGLLFSGVGGGAGAYGWQGARAGAVVVVVATPRCWPQHHDAVRSIMMLLNRFGRCDVVAALTVARNGLWLVYHDDVVNHVMMLLQSLRCRVMVRGCGGRHNAVNIRMMLNFISLSQDYSWLRYHQDAALAITMMLCASS